MTALLQRVQKVSLCLSERRKGFPRLQERDKMALFRSDAHITNGTILPTADVSLVYGPKDAVKEGRHLLCMSAHTSMHRYSGFQSSRV